MYKLTITEVIIKNPDSPSRVFIPTDVNNTDYQEYLKWLAEGNTPEPADEPQGE